MEFAFLPNSKVDSNSKQRVQFPFNKKKVSLVFAYGVLFGIFIITQSFCNYNKKVRQPKLHI